MKSFACIVITIAYLISEIRSVSVTNNLNFRVCTNNDTMQLKVKANQSENSVTCQCQVSQLEARRIRDDYVYTPDIGLHKLHIQANTWNEARKICNEEDAYLAIINSKAEEAVLVAMLKDASGRIRGALNNEEAYLGIHDMFNEGEWITVFGESIYTTGYSNWSSNYFGGQPDNYKGQNCGALINIGGMDDVSCRDKFAFFCEMPVTC